MSNIKAQYETAQTLLWAMKDDLEGNEFDDATFGRKASEYAKQNAKVNRLRGEWERDMRRAAKSAAEGKTDWDWICSHCSRDMRQKPHETCSTGGLCISIAELNERRLHATQREGELTNDLLKQFIDGKFSEDLK